MTVIDAVLSLKLLVASMLGKANVGAPRAVTMALEARSGIVDRIHMIFYGSAYVVNVSSIGALKVGSVLSEVFCCSGLLKVVHNLYLCMPALCKQLHLTSSIQCVLDTQLVCELTFDGSADCSLEEGVEMLWRMAESAEEQNFTGRPAAPPGSHAIWGLHKALSKVLPGFDATNEVVRASIRRAELASLTDGRRAIGINKSKYTAASLELLEAVWCTDVLDVTPGEDYGGVCLALQLLPPRYHVEFPANKVSDIVLDCGSRPRVLLRGGKVDYLINADASDRSKGPEHGETILSYLHGLVTVEADDINHAIERLGGADKFDSNYRAVLHDSLHRISAIPNREGEIIGLTIRIGRALLGAAHPLADVICGMKEKSVLFLGAPGSGKTTLLRDASRMLSQQLQQNVWIVDTYEMAGEGDVPQPFIAHARRMMVPNLDAQARTMVEVVQNHMPKVMIVDEIGRPAEVEAADTVKKRGVRMIATAHGDFRGLSSNPQLKKLLGARVDSILKGGTPVTTRVSKPIFDVVIVLHSDDLFVWDIIADAGKAVDSILRGKLVSATRRRLQNGILTVETINF
eukprot:Rmarinus@m.4987